MTPKQKAAIERAQKELAQFVESPREKQRADSCTSPRRRKAGSRREAKSADLDEADVFEGLNVTAADLALDDSMIDEDDGYISEEELRIEQEFELRWIVEDAERRWAASVIAARSGDPRPVIDQLLRCRMTDERPPPRAWAEALLIAAKSGNWRPGLKLLLECVDEDYQPPPRARAALLNLPTGRGRRSPYWVFAEIGRNAAKKEARAKKLVPRAVRRYFDLRKEGMRPKEACAIASKECGVNPDQLRKTINKGRYSEYNRRRRKTPAK